MNSSDRFKEIRNMVCGVERDGFVNKIVYMLRMSDSFTFERIVASRMPLPWVLCSILKLVMIYGGTNNKLRMIDDNIFACVYNKVLDNSAVYQGELMKVGSINPFMCAINCQQVLYQREINLEVFARINYLFFNGSKNVGVCFEEMNGLSVGKYIDMMFMVYLHVHCCPKEIEFDYGKMLVRFGMKENDVKEFINISSRSVSRLRLELKKDSKIKNFDYSLGEQSPFYNYPLLRLNGGYCAVYSKKIIERSIEIYLYEYVKTLNSKLTQEFDSRFESYVGKILEGSGASYFDEKQLGRMYRGKKTDFLVEEDGCSIMIEVKSVRLKDQIRVSPTRERVLKEFKTSIVDAIFQGHELSNVLQDGKFGKKFYLLIVTYDDVELGAAGTMYDYYFEEYINECFESGKNIRGCLEKNRIFIISSRCFERVCAYRKKYGSFLSLLDDAVLSNEKTETRKFSLSMSLPKEKIPWVKFAHEQFDEAFERILALFPESEVAANRERLKQGTD
ncbi:hypothetical protein N1030_15900 [Desulfovibrio mangrovi]|uniref:hypothetical protein n=1 Tax=Desulfovibrio mangrovi TaxID=2976983 RepID=UPI0022454ABF|nr:hypothetical protein [Desulfovibrio mangrovi]UZP67068.1 hypothetical protein N1030_15900 [Desulfovibrio mangrovi]